MGPERLASERIYSIDLGEPSFPAPLPRLMCDDGGGGHPHPSAERVKDARAAAKSAAPAYATRSASAPAKAWVRTSRA
ncbi:hypothetical protein GCM10010964_23940 [Caldovatus sediminis]|uniref:Uncharacterized protein n=1 Tax=Caldovatus sediminis TaxID=2041189 RepID=A0A8J2ZC24_9PROT|nr:hypothetical protein GCM10010964_23940 [Caldovatus sediminis]